MKNIKFLFGLLGLSIIPLTSQASLTIRLVDVNNTSVTIIDNETGDQSQVFGVNTIVQNLGNWSVSATATEEPGNTVNTPFLSLTSLDISYTGVDKQSSPLKIFLTETGYGPTSGSFIFKFDGSQNSNASIISNFFYDDSNKAFAETTQIGGTQNFSTTSYLSDQSPVGPGGLLSPYSLTIETDIINVPNGFFKANFTSTLSVSSVPLPATIPLLMTGLGFIGLFGRRNKLV